MNQSEYIYKYNDKYRPKFNHKLFDRSDNDLIEAIKSIVYSCERDKTFKIKVIGFEVIDGYDDVNHMLWEYHEYVINKSKAKAAEDKKKTKVINVASSKSSKPKRVATKKKDNPFAYINLKDSNLLLIKITYYIEINEKKNGLVNDTVVAYLAIPKIVDGFYYRLNGNIYSAIYQIVDASTYNNSAAKNAKKQSVTFKSYFSAIRIYRYNTDLIDINGNTIPTTYFVINIFTKSILVMVYLLAKFGFYKCMSFLYLEDIFVVNDISGIDQDIFYIFPVKNCYIACPKMEFDNIQICQSFVYTLYSVINNTYGFKYTDIFTNDIYLNTIGANFTTKDINIIHDKGIAILDSLDCVYDNITRDDLKLPDEDKADIYRVLRWMIYMFNALRQKDNLDITTKKVRYAEHIASYYATKLFLGICRVSDNADRADLDTIRKALQISPMYLVKVMVNARCQLVNYKNCVNDLDSLIALKYTYKGVSGIGEKSNAISMAYRSDHPSHLGRVDIDSSSNSDPGVSGTLCPLSQLYDNHFSEYTEPTGWMEKVNIVLNHYRALKSKRALHQLIENVKNEPETDSDNIRQECIEIGYDLLHNNILPLLKQDNNIHEENSSYIDIFNDGHFIYEEKE